MIPTKLLTATIAAFVVEGCCGGAQTPPPASSQRWFEASPDTAIQGQSLLQVAAGRYSSCRSYRDRGTVITTLWGTDVHGLEISYFDTVFVRDKGLRFRFYDERRALNLVIWIHGDTAESWYLGKARPLRTPTDVLASARGVTAFASELIPRLLLGLPLLPSEQSIVGDQLGTAGVGSPFCGRCRLVALGSSARRRQHVFTIDENAGVIRRHNSFVVFRDDATGSGKPGVVEAEHLVVYEPEFDIENEDLVRELEKRPWS